MNTRMLTRVLLLITPAFLVACRGDVPAPTAALRLPVVRETRSPAAPESGEPELFVAVDGQVILSWVEKVGQLRHALRFATHEPGGWSEPRTVAEGENWFVNWADFPSVVKAPDGTLAAHWLVRSAARKYAYDIRIARSTDGGLTWTRPIVPHRDGTPTEHGFVSLVPYEDGRIGAVWLDGRKYKTDEQARAGEERFIAVRGASRGAGRGEGRISNHEASRVSNHGAGHGTSASEATNEMTLRYAVINPEGTLGDETELDGRVCSCCQTAAALTPEGLVVVYRDHSEQEVRDFCVMRLVAGGWTPPRTLYDDGWQINACPVNGASIAVHKRRVAVAWFTQADDVPQVKVSFSADAGASFGQPLRVDDGAAHGRVDVVLLDDGAALVSWLAGTAEDGQIKARRVAADGSQGDVMIVAETSIARASGFPRMARVNHEVVFAWTEAGAPPRVRTATVDLGADNYSFQE